MPFIMITRNMATKTLRTVLMAIDDAIYHLVSFLIQVIFDIAGFNSNGEALNGVFSALMTRVYLILSIFMFFKVLISLLAYLVNPDAMVDKQKGVGKLVSRIIITLALLIMQPMVFNYLYRLQGPILETLPRVILGTNLASDGGGHVRFNDSEKMAEEGIGIAWSVFNTFYYNNTEECTGGTSLDSWALSGTGNEKAPYKNVFDRALNHVNDSCSANGGNSSIYAYHYTPILPGLAGGFLCYTLIGIAIQVGIRMFKLLILQLIAPIPIISYIDPASSKDGAFGKWVKMVTKTWLDLFINIGIVYIIIYIVSHFILDASSAYSDYLSTIKGDGRGGFLTVFIILAIFAFARQAPKFLRDALGIKEGGSFGKMIAASAAALRAPGSIVRGVSSNIQRDRENGRFNGPWYQNAARGAYSALTGALGGFGTAGMAIGAGMSADKDAMRAANDVYRQRQQADLARIKRRQEVNKQMEDYLKDRGAKKGSGYTVNLSGKSYHDATGALVTSISGQTLDSFENEWNTAKTNGNQTFQWGGHTWKTFGSDASAIEGDMIVAAGKAWADDPNGPSADERATLNDYRRNIRQTGGTGAGSRFFGVGRKDNNANTYKGRRLTAERHAFRNQSNDANRR